MKTVVSIFVIAMFVLLVGFSLEAAAAQSNQNFGPGITNTSVQNNQGVQPASRPVQRASNVAGVAYQQPVKQKQQAPVAQASAAPKIVGYRSPDWKSVHTQSDDEAKQMLAALKKIGCEVETADHGNHIDVKFRCQEWRSMKVKTNALQTQWATWCESQGLETVVVNPPANTRRPTVAFRMAAPRTVHLHDVHKAKQIMNTLKLVGCELTSNDHNGHIDATFSCPEWTTIELTTEDSAHGWQKWLKESGFETQHTHVK